MTRYLVHAIAAARTEPPAGPPGLDGLALVVIGEGGLVAYASPMPDEAEATLGRDALLAHHALVSQLHDALDGVLPARFPTLIDPAGVRAHMRQHASGYAAALTRVRGRVELAVTARWVPPAQWADASPEQPRPEPEQTERPAATTPGAQYMRRRQRELNAAQGLKERAAVIAEALTRALPPGAEVAVTRLAPSAGVALSVAYLVDRAAAVDVIAALGRPRRDVRILINGPWPPYSFATVVREV